MLPLVTTKSENSTVLKSSTTAVEMVNLSVGDEMGMHLWEPQNVSAIDSLFKEMGSVASYYGGIGLAATQVGHTESIILARLTKDPEYARIINPSIFRASESTSVAIEGCLSIPGEKFHVERHDWIVLSGYVHAPFMRLGKYAKAMLKLQGLYARVVQHEIDHLNGVLISDKAVFVAARPQYQINIDPPKNEKTLIISAFPGVGKSYLTSKADPDFIVMDSDSSKFPKEDFPRNYIEHIVQHDGTADVMFVSSHLEVREGLNEAGLKFWVVYPDPKLKEEYIDRYTERGSSRDFIAKLRSSWSRWMDEIGNEIIYHELPNARYHFLKSGEHLDAFISTKFPIIAEKVFHLKSF